MSNEIQISSEQQEIRNLSTELQASLLEIKRLKKKLAESQRKTLELLHFRAQVEKVGVSIHAEILQLDHRLKYPESVTPLPTTEEEKAKV